MDNTRFEQLLWEEESHTVDFKQKQYAFAGATDDEKSELLKDILGFANAWRRSEAYILIGVEEIRGGRSNVVGISATEHLQDHSLQQFVNSLTNRPLHFHYQAYGFESKQVGIIRIELQDRPLCLKRDYGKLRKGEVYVRRGSSTDPTSPAPPDEIAQMGRTSGIEAAELKVEFAELQSDRAIGTTQSWNADHWLMPPQDNIPDYAEASSGDWRSLAYVDPFNRVNPDFYRELATYVWASNLLRRVRLIIQNVGKVPASNVRCELIIRPIGDAYALEFDDFPRRPEQRRMDAALSGLRNRNPAAAREPGAVTVEKNPERLRIGIECGDLQPGRPVWSDVFYLGKRTSGDFEIAGKIYASNLPEPQEFLLVVSAAVSEVEITEQNLVRLTEGLFSEKPDPESDTD